MIASAATILRPIDFAHACAPRAGQAEGRTLGPDHAVTFGQALS